MDVKSDFPLFTAKPKLIYLDSAATTQKPQVVIDALTQFYSEDNSNAGRGMYKLAEGATDIYEGGRGKVAQFIGGKPGEIIFTAGASDSLNMLSRLLPQLISSSEKIKERDEIVVMGMEHHSNYLPWVEMCKREGYTLRVFDVGRKGVDLEKLREFLTDKTAAVCCAHISNVLGALTDISAVCEMAGTVGAKSIIDCAQSIGTGKIDVAKIGCDFLVFSSHKMYGPMGIGVLFGREELLKSMNPVRFGGGMVDLIEGKETVYRESPHCFEVGTPNVSGVVGLVAAIDYITNLGLDAISAHKNELTALCISELEKLDVNCFGGNGIVTFMINNLHSHDIASLLDDSYICVRAGNMCAMPLLSSLDIASATRVSFGVYNSVEDVATFIAALKKILEVYCHE